ncbi:MAG: zinc dependent phospholipase C family protein [Methylotenera sp.]|nr:zinc dependent phospholipase C family protein [Methylotenera sp.]
MTHLYFAHSLLWAMPLLDKRFQQAIKQFPELVMAGACLPDLAIVSQRFRHTHLWENAHHFLKVAQTEEETAIAIGYASHLYIDVIAHHHFVPAHEAMWLKNTIFTHVTAEWAMDAYLAPLVETTPKRLLLQHQLILAKFISQHFRCPDHITNAAIKRLAWADGLLRLVKLPHFIFHLAQRLDQRVSRHFVYYVAKTQSAIYEIGAVMRGHQPLFEPELKNFNLVQLEHWRKQCLAHLSLLHPKPIEYFKTIYSAIDHTHQTHGNETVVIRTPISTTLG